MVTSTNSYWDGTGKFQALYTELNQLIPVEGRVAGSRSHSRKLEKLRTAANAYYDIFNNGGMNRAGEIRYHFDVSMTNYRVGSGRNQRTLWDKIAAKVDPIMDRIILEAAIEQKIIDKEIAETYDVLVS